MCFQNITNKEIIGNVIYNGDDYRSEAINYLRGFVKYLKEETDLSEIAIKIYINRLLKNFFNKGAMNDLLGDINLFIREYSKGGSYYDQRDHNNTLAALKKWEIIIIWENCQNILTFPNHLVGNLLLPITLIMWYSR